MKIKFYGSLGFLFVSFFFLGYLRCPHPFYLTADARYLPGVVFSVAGLFAVSCVSAILAFAEAYGSQKNSLVLLLGIMGVCVLIAFRIQKFVFVNICH
jgi:hypothetical protein